MPTGENVNIDAAKLDALFAPHDRADQPGITVGIAHRGRPAYRRGFGLANAELPVLLSPSIRMRIGSTSKHFTCLLLMLLAEESKLSACDSVRRHIPELPAWADAITLHHLMTHTSGMRCSIDLLFLVAGPGSAAPENAQLKLLTAADSTNFSPSAAFTYCNGGYVLLTEVIQRVTGRPFAEVLTERVLAPAGLHNTVLHPRDTTCLPNFAAPHVPNKKGGFDRGAFGVPVYGEGGMASTVDDMLLWLHQLSAPVVGSTDTWQAMHASARLANGAATGYGLGLITERYRGLTLLHHGGAVIGGSNQMMKVKDHDLDLIIMTNQTINVSELAYRIVDTCVGNLPPLDVQPAPISGTFHSAESGRVLRLSEGAETAAYFGMEAPLEVRSDGTLRLRSNPSGGATLRGVDDWSGIEFVEHGNTDRLVRVEPPLNMGSIAGRYECPSLRFQATVEKETLRLAGPYGGSDYELTPIGDNLWLGRGGELLPRACIVEADNDGLRLSTGRTKRLRFNRC